MTDAEQTTTTRTSTVASGTSPRAPVGATLDIPPEAAVAPADTSIEAQKTYESYQVSVDEYVAFYRQGFLVVRGLVPPDDVQELVAHSEDLIHGRIDIPGMPPPPPHTSAEERERRYLRVHMLHRVLAIHERFLLHPRVLDVLGALIGPDVMALQTMFFLKFPGGAGQGYHQDAYYIPTFPDTLCGAWLAIDRADDENGCLWFTVGSQNEPVYPSKGHGHAMHGGAIGDLPEIRNPSETDESVNTLSRIAAKYPGCEVPVIADPGDVVFFGGHILHRSHRNRSKDRFRRSFVGHYANARSYTQWAYGDADGSPSNYKHILARGWTHLPFAQPRFGTPCAANTPSLRGPEATGGTSLMATMPAGDVMVTDPLDPDRNNPDLHGES